MFRKMSVPAEHVYESDPLSDSRWETFIDGHPAASVFHGKPFLQALQITYGYSPVVLTSCSQRTTMTNGLVFCRIKSALRGKRLVSLPLADHCEPLAENVTELDGLLLYARRCGGEKWNHIEIRPSSSRPGGWDGFQETATYRMHRLDLRTSKQYLYDGFQRAVSKGRFEERNGRPFQYKEENSENVLREFYTLLVATRRRHCLPPHPCGWFRTLIRTFGDKLKIRVASKDGLPIASILTFSYKKSMVYKYGCSDVRFQHYGVCRFYCGTQYRKLWTAGLRIWTWDVPTTITWD
jgi:Acetyltransferase (GNAT) domain